MLRRHLKIQNYQNLINNTHMLKRASSTTSLNHVIYQKDYYKSNKSQYNIFPLTFLLTSGFAFGASKVALAEDRQDDQSMTRE